MGIRYNNVEDSLNTSNHGLVILIVMVKPPTTAY
jgi:hypothetical protein